MCCWILEVAIGVDHNFCFDLLYCYWLLQFVFEKTFKEEKMRNDRTSNFVTNLWRSRNVIINCHIFGILFKLIILQKIERNSYRNFRIILTRQTRWPFNSATVCWWMPKKLFSCSIFFFAAYHLYFIFQFF